MIPSPGVGVGVGVGRDNLSPLLEAEDGLEVGEGGIVGGEGVVFGICVVGEAIGEGVGGECVTSLAGVVAMAIEEGEVAGPAFSPEERFQIIRILASNSRAPIPHKTAATPTRRFRLER
ncbi:MAG: hypothetical protein D6796_13230 [Caldilineae bacterium]|nr:MAG: hypothetical protein D6796_13230 [Caldilineae bacterium]